MKSTRLSRLSAWKKLRPANRTPRRRPRRWSCEPLEARRLLAIDLPAVVLVDTNGNGQMDVAELNALSQSLDSGTYLFARLANGQTRISLPPSPPRRLEANETLITLDFRGGVTGVKWDDMNGNGTRDPGEPGVGGVRIFADLDSDGVFDDGEPSTLTAADGTYRLVLDPGVYAIREVTPPGTIQTFPFGDASQNLFQPLLFAGESLSSEPTSASASVSSRHNARRPADVNDDGRVTVSDALGVVVELRSSGARPLAEGEGAGAVRPMYVDVNGDSTISIADLLIVVYVLRGESEASANDDVFGEQTPDPFTLGANTTQNVLPVLANDGGAGQLRIISLGTVETGLKGVSTVGDRGGQIVIRSGGETGDVVLYTPAPDFYGIERFIYQVRDEADGTTDTAEVTVNVIPDRNYIRFSFQTFQTDGATPANSVEIGQEFILRVFIKDERSRLQPQSDRGVFSAYLDLTYNESLLDVVTVPPIANPHGFSRDVRFGDQYQELVSVDGFLPGLIDEAGATQTDGFIPATQPLGPNAIPFFDVRFRATGTGTANFAGNAPDVPTHQLIFFRPSNLEALNPAFVDFGQLNLTITPPLGAVPDAFTRNEDLIGPPGSPLANPILDLLANDNPFVPGQPLRITGLGPTNASVITTAVGSQVEIINNGLQVRYTPAQDFHGSDSFTYRASDGTRSETAVVTVTVLPVNDAPVARDDTFVADNAALLTVNAPGVLRNDTDVDGDLLAVTAFQATSALGAQVSVNPTGRFTYNPLTSPTLQNIGPGEVVTDTFTYTVSDGNGGSATATVRVFVSRNTGGAHVVEILPGQITPNVNFGNMRLEGEGEWEDVLASVALDRVESGK